MSQNSLNRLKNSKAHIFIITLALVFWISKYNLPTLLVTSPSTYLVRQLPNYCNIWITERRHWDCLTKLEHEHRRCSGVAEHVRQLAQRPLRHGACVWPLQPSWTVHLSTLQPSTAALRTSCEWITFCHLEHLGVCCLLVFDWVSPSFFSSLPRVLAFHLSFNFISNFI